MIFLDATPLGQVSPSEATAKAELVSQVLELQNTLDGTPGIPPRIIFLAAYLFYRFCLGHCPVIALCVVLVLVFLLLRSLDFIC